ncbi:MAG: hypothetical protein IJ239_07055 [Eubacterium sp.]|nr:hypothetical protein [Eubacterium sp.]
MIQTIVAVLCVSIVAVACIWGYRLDHGTGNKDKTETKENTAAGAGETKGN